MVGFASFSQKFQSDNHGSYDLQVSCSSQRGGLGRSLLRWLENIGIAWGMDKLVLTVLKSQFHGLMIWQLAYDVFLARNGRQCPRSAVLCCFRVGLS